MTIYNCYNVSNNRNQLVSQRTCEEIISFQSRDHLKQSKMVRQNVKRKSAVLVTEERMSYKFTLHCTKNVKHCQVRCKCYCTFGCFHSIFHADWRADASGSCIAKGAIMQQSSINRDVNLNYRLPEHHRHAAQHHRLPDEG